MKLKQVAIAFDQLLNTFIGSGWADETLSARAYRNSAKGIPRWQTTMQTIDLLFFWQESHCLSSFRMEQDRLHMPPAYRTTYDKAESNETAV